VAEEVYISINELRDSLALNRFGSSFDNCTEQEREACRLAYPCEVLEHGMNVDGENPFWVTDVLPLSSSTQESVCDSDFFVDDVSQPQSGTVISDYVDVADTEYIYVEEEAEDEDETIFQVVDQQAEFPGGMQALYKYLGDNIQYPRVSRENNSQGRVFIRFVVNSDGSIQDAEVIKSSGDVYLDKEAVRVIAGMPKWKPGVHSGKPVRVYYTVPVMFRLQ
jgi:protein TonB